MSSQPDSGSAIPDRLGDFQLLERLGAGGMGVVFRARDEVLSREVALKLILPENLYFEEARERFRREVEAAAKLTHPGIVPIYSVGEAHDLPFFTMELIAGASLANVIEHVRDRDPGELSGADLRDAIRACTPDVGQRDSTETNSATFAGTWVQACCRIAIQIADALQHAHERGVLHRDVKPSNIVVTPSGRAMLLDFGLASTSESNRITRTGSQAGSLPYMPPERIQRGLNDSDARGDVYSLGVSLYELLALRLPFEGETVAQRFQAITSGEYTALRQLNSAVPIDAGIVCAKAIEHDPARRYADAGSFARDLHNLLELRPIEAQRPSTALRARRWVQRNPTASVAAALGFLLVVVAPGVAWWRIKRERDVAVMELKTNEAMLEFMLGMISGADSDEGRSGDRTVYELIDAGAERIGNSLTEDPEVRGRLMLDLAIMESKLGRPKQALALGRQALELLQAQLGPHDHQVGRAQRFVGVEMLQLGEIDEGARILEQSHENLRSTDDADSIETARTDVELAMALLQAGRYTEARTLMESAADTGGWKTDSKPADRITWFTNMGQVSRGLGERDAAIEFHRKAVAEARTAFGDIHDDVARTLQDLAVALLENGDIDGALERLLEARSIREQLHAGESIQDARLEFNLATVYTKKLEFEKSIEAYDRVFEMCRRLAGDSIQTAKAASGKGMALIKLGRFEEAEPVLREALDLSRRFIPRKGRIAAEAPLLLARCLTGLDRRDEAVPLYTENFELIAGDSAVTAELEAKWRGEFADVLTALGRDAEAADQRERQRQLLESVATPSH